MHHRPYHIAVLGVWLAGTVISTLAAARHSAGCIAPNTLVLDTLTDNVVEVTEKDAAGDTVAVDTVSGGMMIAEMLEIYDSVAHCAVATVDTVVVPPESPYAGSDPGVALWHIESTLVKIDTVLKGTFPDSFWQVDTISGVMVVAKRTVQYQWYQSYSSVEERTFLFFGDSASDLRTMRLLEPGGLCEPEPRGFFVDGESMITRVAGAYADSSRYPGIEVALEELVAALTAEYSLRYVGHLIECLVNPCPGFTVTDIRTGEASMTAALHYQGQYWEDGAAFLDGNSYYRGYFDTKKLEGWSIWSDVFVVTAVMPSTPLSRPAGHGTARPRRPAFGIRRTGGGISPVILVPGAEAPAYDISGRHVPISRPDALYPRWRD